MAGRGLQVLPEQGRLQPGLPWPGEGAGAARQPEAWQRAGRPAGAAVAGVAQALGPWQPAWHLRCGRPKRHEVGS